MLGTIFLLALRSIRRHMLRSFLTILGIVIGVAAVITMVTLGNGATQAVQTKIASLGSNLLMVRPGQRQGPGGAGGGSVPSFKDPALADLFESLMAEGVEFTSNEYPANLNRDFSGVVRAENGLEIRVCICVYVKNDSDVCRRVVKSSKTVEQFEYEIVCD